MKKIETVEEAEAFLATCEREVLYDRTFGDEEVYWYNGLQEARREVAWGYFGPTSNEVGSLALMTDTEEQKALHWHFTQEDAKKLRHCGKLVSSERNDVD